MDATRGVAPKDIAVIVTGAARGIGRAMTLGLARAGVRVAALDLPSSKDAMAEVIDSAREFSNQERIFAIACDVRLATDCANAVKSAVSTSSGRHRPPAESALNRTRYAYRK